MVLLEVATILFHYDCFILLQKPIQKVSYFFLQLIFKQLQRGVQLPILQILLDVFMYLLLCGFDRHSNFKFIIIYNSSPPNQNHKLQQFYQQQMNSNQIKTKRIRAISANQSRPISGSSRHGHKTQFIENVYNTQGNATNRRQAISFIAGRDQHHKFKKLMPTRQSKQYEQYFEQIMHLKSTINKLNDTITLQKTKIQTLQKRNNKYDKQLKMEFQKQIYWTGTNTHMITGIKSSYDALKAKYEEKCKLFDKISKQIQYTQIKQYKIYAENLEKENNRLVERLDMLLQSVNKPTLQNKKQISDYLLLELEKKNKELEEDLNKNITLLKTANQEIKDRDKKIMFIQKLIIEKDNAQYHSHKKAKKFEKERIQLNQQTEKLKIQIESDRELSQRKIDQLKQMYEDKIAKQKEIYDNLLKEKDSKLAKNQKQLTYLSTLLTYKKPNEESKEISQKLVTEQRSIKQQNFFLGNNLKQSFIKERRNSFRRGSNDQDILTINKALAFQIDQQSQYKSQPAKRVQQTAVERHSQNAEKKRKVTFDELKDISELLKYKFIAQSLDIEQVKKYFNYTKSQKSKKEKSSLEEPEQEGNSASKVQEEDQEESWKEKYLTMGELMEILQTPPFGLIEESAILLSRYMVQDSPNQYVYYDNNNQELRSIIKSIIKALAGQYEVFSSQQRQALNKQCDTILKMYESNLLSALKAVASSGYVSHRKFIELISSLGIQMSDHAKEILIGRLAMQSENLNKLKYRTLWSSSE